MIDLEKKCQECKRNILPKVASYSFHAFGKELCINCQKKEREKIMAPKLAKFLNEELK